MDDLKFPKPPIEKMEAMWPVLIHAPELRDWAYETFIYLDARLHNPDHQHLEEARILFVWSSVDFKDKGRRVVGVAATGKQSGQLGSKELRESVYMPMTEGVEPDFIITICAPYVLEASPASICALIEHELYHCGIKKDEYGEPKYVKRGGLREPVFGMRPHDIEEFHGVIQRYGRQVPEIRDLAGMIALGASLDESDVQDAVCGCGARVG